MDRPAWNIVLKSLLVKRSYYYMSGVSHSQALLIGNWKIACHFRAGFNYKQNTVQLLTCPAGLRPEKDRVISLLNRRKQLGVLITP